jgi:hypothetical protein
MVHEAFSLAFNLSLSFELCLASFLGPFCFGTFWRLYSKGGECGTKATLCLKLTSGFKNTYMWFKGCETKGENVNMKIKKGEV